MRRLWVVLVTEGRRVRFAPEVYPTQLRAERESYRWGWFSCRRGGVEDSGHRRAPLAAVLRPLVEETLSKLRLHTIPDATRGFA
jgi:hypothetical protein